MILIPVGYSGSGSSALVDLFSEYESCSIGKLPRFEHVILYTPNGLFDLEDRLHYNNSIHGSDAAIRLFVDEMKRLNYGNFGWFGSYQQNFGNIFMDNVDAFVCELVQYTAPGDWAFDYRYEKTITGAMKDTIKILLHRKRKNKFGYQVVRKSDEKILFSFVTPNTFYCAAKRFIYNYLQMISSDTSKNLVCDQLLLPHNVYRLDKYFDDAKAVIVDRDPRDMYVLSKYVWPSMGFKRIFPDNPQDFVEFYRGLHQSVPSYESANVLQIHFEDLVYNYEKTVSKIEHFTGLKGEEHNNKYRKFNPKISVKNTQNFRIKQEWECEVKYIEESLSEYLYEFPIYLRPTISETTNP